MSMNDIKISLKMKNKGWLSIEKKYCDMRKNKDLLTFAVFKKQLK